MEKSNIDEKIKLLTGSGMWHTQEVEGLPSVHLSDGPHGLRKQEEKERGCRFPCLCAQGTGDA